FAYRSGRRKGAKLGTVVDVRAPEAGSPRRGCFFWSRREAHPARSRSMLHTCQAGFESLFVRELAELHQAPAWEQGAGWVRAAGVGPPGAPCQERLDTAGSRALTQLVFAHMTLLDPVERRGDSVNSLASGIVDFFRASIRDERVETAW